MPSSLSLISCILFVSYLHHPSFLPRELYTSTTVWLCFHICIQYIQNWNQCIQWPPPLFPIWKQIIAPLCIILHCFSLYLPYPDIELCVLNDPPALIHIWRQRVSHHRVSYLGMYNPTGFSTHIHRLAWKLRLIQAWYIV